MKFKNDLTRVKKLHNMDDVVISKLPQLYRADMKFALEQGNEQLNNILAQVPEHKEFKHVSIDSRSHMLMRGMYPCIPGWHCDDFYRTSELHGQPDLENVHKEAPAIHYLVVLGDNSKTEFLDKNFTGFKWAELPTPAQIQEVHGHDAPVYLHYDRLLDSVVDRALMGTRFVVPNTLYKFGPTAFHRGSPATHNGWRCFIRVTFSNHREPKNELRYQTQVYTDGRVSW